MDNFKQALLRLKEQLGISTDKAVGELLGLKEKAFNARKSRGSFPETELRALAQRQPELGIDVDYVLSGIASAAGFAFAPDTRSGFGAVVGRMHKCLGNTTGLGGPELLGVPEPQFAKWRKEGVFPADFLADFARECGVTVEWLEFGEAPPDGGAQQEVRPIHAYEAAEGQPAAQRLMVAEPGPDSDLRAAIEMVGDELAAQNKMVSGAELYVLIERAQRYIRRGRTLQARQERATEEPGNVNENAKPKSHSRSS